MRIDNYNENTILSGTSGADDIWINVTDYVTVVASDGDDTIGAWTDYSTLNAGAGNDTIHLMGHDTTIKAGRGNDGIDLYTDSDSYWDKYYAENVIQYAEGDGKDIITGFKENDTIQITSGTYTTTKSGDDVIIKVGSGSITVKNAPQTIKIDGEENLSTDTVIISPVSTIINGSVLNTSAPIGNGTIINRSLVQNLPDAKKDSVENKIDTNSLQTNDSGFLSEEKVTPAVVQTPTNHTYTGGNQNITNYSADRKINFHANFTGIGFNATDFMLNSSSGTLTIKNARDKLLDIAVNDNTVAYAYMASGAGNINKSSFSVLEVIIGGDHEANVITAGSGGSSLWGGVGGYDTLTGGAGQDNFFFGKSDGVDVITNASSSDIVNLYDVTLADIVTTTGSSNQISIGLSSGGNLKINSTGNLSATFKLADGTNWKFNHNSNSWQGV